MTRSHRYLAALALSGALLLSPLAAAALPVGGDTAASQTAACWPTAGASGHVVDQEAYVWSAVGTIRCASQAVGELVVSFESGREERAACAGGSGIDPICELQIDGTATRGDCMLITARTTSLLQGDVVSTSSFCIAGPGG